jgi:hypothetical protein
VHDGGAVEFVNGAKFHLIGKLVYFWGPGMVVYKGGNEFFMVKEGLQFSRLMKWGGVVIFFNTRI